MPWSIERRNGKHCVVKQGESKPVPGGCHDTRAEAIKHQRALYANEKMEVTEMATVEAETPTATAAWEGPLGLVGHPTSDGRYLIPGEIGNRDLPLPLYVQTMTGGEGHANSVVVGRIESIDLIPVGKFDRAAEFGLSDLPPEVTVVWGEGVFDAAPDLVEEAQTMMRNGGGVSLDLPPERRGLFDPDTLEEVDMETVDLGDVMAGKYLMGSGGKIAGATLVGIPAFEDASIRLSTRDGAIVASGMHWNVIEPTRVWEHFTGKGAYAFVASGGKAIPMTPPREWFQDPGLSGLTPLTITEDGRVYGHLCAWDSCHTGYQGVCVSPPHSPTDYAYFNVGLIDTVDGPVACGKLMFSRDGGKHAPLSANAREAAKHYDDATKVGAYVRAGADAYGIYLAGTLKQGLAEADVAHLRAHPPSGDWRGVNGAQELVAAFAVAVPGFPIPQAEARLVASADGDEITSLILAPLAISDRDRSFIRQRAMLSAKAHAFDDGFRDVSTDERKRLAKTGAAMPDGSFPIANCSDATNARRALGRAPAAKREAVRRHIARREKALGCAMKE